MATGGAAREHQEGAIVDPLPDALSGSVPAAPVTSWNPSDRTLFEHHPGPMWLYDLDTLRFLSVNDAAVASYGYSRDEFLAMTVDELRAPVVNDDAHKAGDAPNVFRHRRKDGMLMDVLVSSDAIEFDGRRAGLALAQDLTEQHRLEAQLRQAQKMEAIGNLAGGIAHDFNNLLLVIRGYSSILLKSLTDEKLRSSAEQIDNAARQASEFTHQLLAFSRQQVLRPEVTDLNTVVTETLRMLHRSLGEAVHVESELEPALRPVLVDRGQIAQAVLNLAINARDSMNESGSPRSTASSIRAAGTSRCRASRGWGRPSGCTSRPRPRRSRPRASRA